MDYETACSRLLNHANIAYSSNAPDDQSLLFTFWKANRDKVVQATFAVNAQDVIACLEVVNIEWNGSVPSEATTGEASSPDPRIVRAVTGIIHEGWEYYLKWQQNEFFDSDVLQQVALANWRISFAWRAVLDGDIDSLSQEIKWSAE